MRFAGKRVVVLGMMSKMPVAGVVWQTLHYLTGFRRLGCEVFYVEAHGIMPTKQMRSPTDDGASLAAAFLARTLGRFDFDGAWAYHGLHENPARCFGMSESRLREVYAQADVLINLHGGTLPRAEHEATGRLVYLETDPVEMQILLFEEDPKAVDFLSRHAALFTFGENYGKPSCLLPVSERFRFKPTRQPVVLDFWRSAANGQHAAHSFTTVGNWRQHRPVHFRGEVYHWSKQYEFQRFLDVPERTKAAYELALSNCDEETRRHLEAKNWRVRDALALSDDVDAYRHYITSSRGEFTVAKEQNVRLRTGWFSDRSATYLAASRPVVTQETGFSEIFPTGRGLFAFDSVEEIESAVEEINSDYESHSRAAHELARTYFDSDVVLARLLEDIGV